MMLPIITLLLRSKTEKGIGKSPLINVILQDPLWGSVTLIGFTLFSLWLAIRFFKCWDKRE